MIYFISHDSFGSRLELPAVAQGPWGTDFGPFKLELFLVLQKLTLT